VAALETLFGLESLRYDGEDLTTTALKRACERSMDRNAVRVGEDRDFVRALVLGVSENKDEYDTAIASRSEGWPLHRIGRIEVAIMRMALQEMTRMDTPRSVVINEAVELAKKYVSRRAASFINGILGALVTCL